jgi:hypothetical protein
MAGAADAFRFTHVSTRVYELLTLQAIREHRAYESLDMTWEQFCTQVLGRSRRAVEEDLATLEQLGEDFMRVAQQLGLGRDALRALRRLPADARPRVLPSGEIEIGGERVSIDDRDSVIDLIDELVQSRVKMQQQIEEGVKQLADLSSRIEELERRPKYESTASEAPEIEGRLLQACRLLSQAWQLIQDEEPTDALRSLVMHYVRVIDTQYLREMTAFATGWRPHTEVPEGLDPEAYHELEEEERREARARRREKRS